MLFCHKSKGILFLLFYLIFLFLPPVFTEGRVENNDWEWGVEVHQEFSWQVLQLRNTEFQLISSPWIDSAFLIQENDRIEASMLFLEVPDFPFTFVFNVSTTSSQPINCIVNLKEILPSNTSLIDLGKATFFVPSSPGFWDELEKNYTACLPENGEVHNDEKTFSLWYHLHESLPRIEWAFDKSTGVLRYYWESFEEHIIIHIKRTDLLEPLDYLGPIFRFLGPGVLFLLIIMAIFFTRARLKTRTQ